MQIVIEKAINAEVVMFNQNSEFLLKRDNCQLPSPLDSEQSKKIPSRGKGRW